MCCGLGSNSKGELLTLWMILLFSNHLKLYGIHIYCDSKVLIDWDSNDNNVNILPILTWMKNIILLISKFKDIYFSHVYRKQNQLADPLSKKVLQVEEGFMFSDFERMDLYYHRIRSKIFSYSSLRIPKVYFMCFFGACQWIFGLHTLFWTYFVSFCFFFLVYLSLYLFSFISLNVNFLLYFLLCNISTYLHILSIYGIAFVCKKKITKKKI